MEWLNYHHLHYFWVVAREGGLTAAGKVLGVSHPTLSTQIQDLEARVGLQLFSRTGRKLTLTDAGRTAYTYADEIFSLGREMVDVLRGELSGQAARLNVGVADVIPKLVVRRLLQPALRLEQPARLVCYEDRHAKLLADLALHALHVVISDAPVAPGSTVRAFNHSLGESSVSLFAAPDLARKYRRGFPQSLDGAPMLLPLEEHTLRRSLNQWFSKVGVAPRVVAEFEDSALFKVFGADGVGLFPAPTVVEREVIRQYDVCLVGRVEGVRERFYAITAERRLTHPAVLAISDAAKHDLFAE